MYQSSRRQRTSHLVPALKIACITVASLQIACITVGEQITIEQLIEKRIVMKISKAMIMNIGITSRDVNGAPYPPNPWGIHLLGGGDG